MAQLPSDSSTSIESPQSTSLMSEALTNLIFSSRLEQRLRSQLLQLTNRFLSLCNDGPPVVVSSRFPGAKFHSRDESYFLSSGAEYYIISEDFWSKIDGSPSQDRMFAGEMTVESDPMQLGALTYNCCVDAAYVHWEFLHEMFKKDPEMKRVEWARVPVRPRIVFFWENKIGDETRYLHDIIIIVASNGARFVFDPTGYQFGFGGYVHKWETYKKQFIDKEGESLRASVGTGRSVNPQAAMASYRGSMQAAREELMRRLSEGTSLL
ncbi:uncharacterized protein K460DRAFT_407611 [Cucurbitaria berberidis CBS 394.84]|uniref:Uncharacterized protein n=1 Tax=Cucurbitaria berberidis CBS 394.84 TaxID=1168544 RepID=A0A9P4L5Z9_9PLEO|nr:uncharacterized protein K460DRAFT_407611 [Cucurbitaria berberidis CBS 394.84]KAF1843245.1 hypothetical protein K460DRAFT_407611 [Cucurbitaria berberidis CBS 394.84]